MSTSDPFVLPPWGEKAKSLRSSAWGVFSALGILVFIMRGADALFGWKTREWLLDTPLKARGGVRVRYPRAPATEASDR